MKRLIQIVFVMVIFAGLSQPEAMATTNRGLSDSWQQSIGILEKNTDGNISESGITELVSVASDGTHGSLRSYQPSISSNGRYVAFSSHSSNLVSEDTNNTMDVFIHDRQTGETERISVASDGTQGNNDSLHPSISADGRHVAFESEASNLVSGDTNDYMDVFIHDRLTRETERVSVASNGIQGNDNSLDPSISENGMYVGFVSSSNNLVSGDTNECQGGRINGHCPDVFVHDREMGTTERVSVASDGTQGNDQSYRVSISADGRFVAIGSNASNLVSGDTNALWDIDIFIHDRQTRVTEQVSVASDGSQGNKDSDSPSISADGRYVAFASHASNLVSGDTNTSNDIYVYDRILSITQRVSVASDGTQGNNDSYVPSISANGMYVAFASVSNNLVTGDANDTTDVFIHNLQTGVTELISISSDGAQGNSYSLGQDGQSISAYGRYVAFESEASNLVSGDTNGENDIFVRDREWIAVGDVDLDISNQSIRMATYQHQIKQYQPFSTFLNVDVYNHGNNNVSNVNVQFYSGPPDTGSLLGSTILSGISAGSSETARFEWVTTSSSISIDVYVKVSSSQTDTNLNNNITSSGTHVYTAFADYKFDPHTFYFNNFPLTWEQFLAEWIIFITHISPDFWRYIAGPYNYAKYAEGGHCYGMSSASIIYWDTPLAKPFPIDTFDFEPYQAALDLHDHHVRQIFTLERDNPTTAENIYDEVKHLLSLPTPQPSLIDFFWESLYSPDSGRHGVVGYKIVEVGSQKYLYIYDNEDPMGTNPGNEDPVNIFTLTENGDFFDYDNQNARIIRGNAIEPLRDPIEVTLEMIEDMAEAVLRYLTTNEHLQLFFSWTNVTAIQNSDSLTIGVQDFLVVDEMDRKVGYEAGVFVSEIPGAEFSEFEGAYYLTLPADGEYSLMLISQGITNAQLSLAIPLSATQVQETVFTDFNIPIGAGATTSFNQTTTDWRIEIDGQVDVVPNTDQIETLTSSLHLPIIVR